MSKFTLSPIAAGNLLALGATIIWSSIYILARTLADSFSPVELSFWRWIIAFAAIIPFVYKQIWAARHIIRRHIIFLGISSAFGMTGFTLMIFIAGRSTSATNMSLLAATAPVFIALITRFILREKLSVQQAVGLCIAICGVSVLVTRGNLAHILNMNLGSGDLYMLGGALCFGIYSILVRFKPKELPQTTFLSVLMGLGALWLLPGVIQYWIFIRPAIMPTFGQCLSLLHIGVVTSVIAFLMWNQAIVRIGVVRTGIIYYSLPFFSYILAMTFLGEKLSLPQLIGGILIIGGIVFSSLEIILNAHKSERIKSIQEDKK